LVFALSHGDFIVPDRAEGVNRGVLPRFAEVSRSAQPRRRLGPDPRAISPPLRNAPHQPACQRSPFSRSARFRDRASGPHPHTVRRCKAVNRPAGTGRPAYAEAAAGRQAGGSCQAPRCRRIFSTTRGSSITAMTRIGAWQTGLRSESTCQTRRIRSRHRLDGSFGGGGGETTGRWDGSAGRGGLPHRLNLRRCHAVAAAETITLHSTFFILH
jgi:hypothetical protein